MSKKNSDENNKAYFLQRLLAYVLDMTIVVLVSTLIKVWIIVINFPKKQDLLI